MTTKIAISLPDELVAQAKAAVAEGRAASVSSYVAEALREKQHRLTLGEVLDLYDAEFGPPSEDDHEWAREALRSAGLE